MYRSSRRWFVAAAGAGAVTATAGCTGVLDGSDDGNGDGENGGDGNDGNGTDGDGDESDAGATAQVPAYADWLAADAVTGSELGFFHVDIQRVRSEWPAQALQEFGIEEMATELLVEPDDLESMIVLDRPDSAANPMEMVVTGSFDQEAVVEEISMGMETERYGEYEVIMEEVAISPDAVVIGGSYDLLIDAHTGEIDRIADTDDEWERALRNVGGAGLSGVMADADEEYELMGVAMDADNGDVAVVAYVHFADAETAEAEQEEAEANAEEEFVEDGTITDIRVEGNVVIVEGTIHDFEW